MFLIRASTTADNPTAEKVIDWIRHNCKEKTYKLQMILSKVNYQPENIFQVKFYNPKDAILFKLMWV